jgi:hypothetical protein
MLPTGQKLTLGPLATITLKLVPCHAYELFPELLSFFKSIQEVMFCEGVRHHLQFCLNHLNCVKIIVSSIIETERSHRGSSLVSGVDGAKSHFVFSKNALV